MKTTSVKLMKGLTENLWQQYIRRVPYARIYSDLVTEKGGKVAHDHISFRTFNTNTGEQPNGIKALGHLFEILNYQKSGKYKFSKMKATAAHFEHPDPLLPKIFVSQLEVAELPGWAQFIINDCVAETHYLISDEAIELLNNLGNKGSITNEAGEILVEELTGYFRRPWKLPTKDDLLKINDVSPYAAWTLLHGNSVNHFAAAINFQGVSIWPDIETTCRAMAEEGIPMKNELEGKKGSILRQSATLAVKETIPFRGENGEIEEMDWTYAYYEFTERGYIIGEGGEKLFTGFIPDQDTQLFKMTETREN